MCAGVCGSECGVACTCEWWGGAAALVQGQARALLGWRCGVRGGWAGALYSPRRLVPVKEAPLMLVLMSCAAARMWRRLAVMSVALPVMTRVLPSWM